MHSYSTHPARWRETCDPFALRYWDFQLIEVLGYPHAGNDVFHVRGVANGRETKAYIKVARQEGADIENEVRLLTQLNAPVFPKVLDYDRERGAFSVTEELPGSRLSAIVGENAALESLDYMEAYGEALAQIHQMHLSAKPQADRKFRHCPRCGTPEKAELAAFERLF